MSRDKPGPGGLVWSILPLAEALAEDAPGADMLYARDRPDVRMVEGLRATRLASERRWRRDGEDRIALTDAARVTLLPVHDAAALQIARRDGAFLNPATHYGAKNLCTEMFRELAEIAGADPAAYRSPLKAEDILRHQFRIVGPRDPGNPTAAPDAG